MELLGAKSRLARGAALWVAAWAMIPSVRADTCARAWTEGLGRRLGRSISVAAGRVYATTTARRVVCLDLHDGHRVWAKKRRAGVQAGVTCANGAVLGVSDHPQGFFFCLDSENGDDRWERRLGEAYGAPLVVGGRAFAASLRGTVVACSLRTGELIWSREIPGLVRAPLGHLDSLLFVGTVADSLLALSIGTGQTRWAVSAGGALYGAPAMEGGRLWSLAYGGHLTGRDPATGEVALERHLEGRYRTPVAVAPGRLIVLSTGGRLRVLDSQTLEDGWMRDLQVAADLPPVVEEGRVWVALRDGTARAFRWIDGPPVGRVVGGAPSASPLQATAIHLLVGNTAGDITAFFRQGMEQGALPGVRKRDRPDGCAQRATVLAAPGPGAAWGHGILPLRDLERPTLSGWGRLWLLGWVAGTGLALWCQNEADDAYESYRRTGAPGARGDALDRAERYDRSAILSWGAAEICFLLTLRDWLGGEGSE